MTMNGFRQFRVRYLFGNDRTTDTFNSKATIFGIKTMLHMPQVLVGNYDKFSNKDAILIRYTNIEALSEIQDLNEDTVILRPGFALATSSRTPSI